MSSTIRGIRLPHMAIALIVGVHVMATFVFFSPTLVLTPQPLEHIDNPVHTHRVAVYREALLQGDLPWGYDPAVSAGLVVRPSEDVGAKAQQILGVVLPFLSPAAVVKLFLFLTALALPLITYGACALIGFPRECREWAMVFLVACLWAHGRIQGFIAAGLTSFVAASAFAPLVLAIFLNYLDRPSRGSYIRLVAGASLLFLLHPLGPWILLGPLVIFTLFSRPLDLRWRVLAVLVPAVVVLLNLFWLVPYVLGQRMDPGPHFMPEMLYAPRHLTYSGIEQLLSEVDLSWVGVRIASATLIGVGFVSLRKIASPRVAWCLLLTAIWLHAVGYFGSFVPMGTRLQPVRFLVPAFVLMAPLAGAAAPAILRFLRVEPRLGLFGAISFLAVLVMWPGAGVPNPVPRPQHDGSFAEFVRTRTSADARLLVESSDGFRVDGYEARVLPMAVDREVIGSTFPMTRDPAQFVAGFLLGRPLEQWTPASLREAVDRWGVSWAFARTPEAEQLFEGLSDEPGEAVGDYLAFRLGGSASKFLKGRGVVDATINRLELTRLEGEEGLVVLRYRFNPAWRVHPPARICQYPVPEDPSGFIGLVDPPERVSLTLDTWSLLDVSWPDGTAECPSP